MMRHSYRLSRLAALALAAVVFPTGLAFAQLDVQVTSQIVSVNAASKVSYETSYSVTGGSPTTLVAESLLVSGSSVVYPPGCGSIQASCPNAVRCTVSGSSPFTIQGGLPASRLDFTSRVALRSLGADGKDQYELTYGNNLGLQRMVALSGVNGDVNADDAVNPSDTLYLINHLFASGPRPGGPSNVNGDCAINTSDVLYLINYLSAGGPPPVWPSCSYVTGAGAGMAAGPNQSSPDELRVGDVVVDINAGVARVPVYVKDNPGTLVGADEKPGERITRVIFRVTYESACISATSFDLSKQTLVGSEPLLLHTPTEPKHSQTVFLATTESKGGLDLSSNATEDGAPIGDLVVNLDGCKPGLIPLEVTTVGTAVAELASDHILEETTLNGGLVVKSGSITVR